MRTWSRRQPRRSVLVKMKNLNRAARLALWPVRMSSIRHESAHCSAFKVVSVNEDSFVMTSLAVAFPPANVQVRKLFKWHEISSTLWTLSSCLSRERKVQHLRHRLPNNMRQHRQPPDILHPSMCHRMFMCRRLHPRYANRKMRQTRELHWSVPGNFV